MDIKIECAEPGMAPQIASLIMEAMNHECCQNFAGAHHTLADFHRMMTMLVKMEDSQYSYRNTLVAIAPDGSVAGICVAYDGGMLHTLRRRFVEAARQAFGIDYSGMDDETAAGEYYVDSLCVDKNFRGMGIATRLLKAAIGRGRDMGIPAVGLLVDKGNPKAEKLYRRLGFEYAGDTVWGGHEMKHLLYIQALDRIL